MIVLIAYITLVVIYTISCILDAPDVRKAWTVSRSKKYRFVYFEKAKETKLTHILLRFSRFKASEDPNEIKDKVYILPCLCYYYNTSTFCVSIAWLVFYFEYWHKNWLKYDEMIRSYHSRYDKERAVK